MSWVDDYIRPIQPQKCCFIHHVVTTPHVGTPPGHIACQRHLQGPLSHQFQVIQQTPILGPICLRLVASIQVYVRGVL